MEMMQVEMETGMIEKRRVRAETVPVVEPETEKIEIAVGCRTTTLSVAEAVQTGTEMTRR